jgi:hypothetical protein
MSKHSRIPTLLRWLIVIPLCLSYLIGCDRGLELAATEVLNNTNCKGAEEGLRKVSYADVARLRGSTLLSMTGSAGTAEPSTAAGKTQLLLFAVSQGRQPTPGYFFTLKDARLKDGVAELQLNWQTPDAESVQAQVITYPCIVIGVEAGEFRDVRALDQDGELLGEVRI